MSENKTATRKRIPVYGIEKNFLFDADSYKHSHPAMLEPGTQKISCYFESRGGEYPYNVIFGLQPFLQSLEKFVVTREMMDDAEQALAKHFGSNEVFRRAEWEHILTEHGGKLPISIKAVPEGTVIDGRNVIYTIENTCPHDYFLPGWIETKIVRASWYPITVATRSFTARLMMQRFAEETGTPKDVLSKLHDFGARGVSSDSTAALGSTAHLAVFRGTDTLLGIELARRHYGEEMAGFSVPASEHLIMTIRGKKGEEAAVRQILKAYPKGIVSIVGDSYDIINFAQNIIGGSLREEVRARDGKVVVRLDSGDAKENVLKVLQILADGFGYSTNRKGYKVLNPHVGILQGDGVTHAKIEEILNSMKEAKWSIDNIVFGSGGWLLQQENRDTLAMAQKASAAVVDGTFREVWKEAPGKASKRGMLKLIRKGDGFATVKQEEEGEDQLVEVFRNGEVLVEYTLSEIRDRVEAAIPKYILRTAEIKAKA